MKLQELEDIIQAVQVFGTGLKMISDIVIHGTEDQVNVLNKVIEDKLAELNERLPQETDLLASRQTGFHKDIIFRLAEDVTVELNRRAR